jgi:hypothetical protein
VFLWVVSPDRRIESRFFRVCSACGFGVYFLAIRVGSLQPPLIPIWVGNVGGKLPRRCSSLHFSVSTADDFNSDGNVLLR